MAKEKITLLVVDDNPKVAWMLREGLDRDEYEILAAPDGKKGIQMMIEEQPRVIILDIKLPGMNGMEVLERIRSINRRVEIIMLSGYGETKQIVRAMQLGASDFISKPFDVEEVDIHIRSVLEESGWRVKGKGNAAARLGLNPSTLRSRMKKLGIARP